MIQIEMKMPIVCGECPFADYTTREYPYCLVLKADRGYPFDVNRKRFPNCPLKETDNSRQEAELIKRREMCRVLFNRCRAVVNAYGEMCMFCGLREECEAEHTV